MKIVKINPKNPDPTVIKEACKILGDGGIVVYPTDTCYGAGVDASNPNAVRKLFQAKSRGYKKPFSVIVRDVQMLKDYAEISHLAKKIIEKYLPGPLTIILPIKKTSGLRVSSKNTIGIRIPDYPICQALAKKFGAPYTSTSANLSGHAPTYDVKNIELKADLILDAGRIPQNPSSTIIDLIGNKPKILRQGGLKIKIE